MSAAATLITAPAAANPPRRTRAIAPHQRTGLWCEHGTLGYVVGSSYLSERRRDDVPICRDETTRRRGKGRMRCPLGDDRREPVARCGGCGRVFCAEHILTHACRD